RRVWCVAAVRRRRLVRTLEEGLNDRRRARHHGVAREGDVADAREVNALRPREKPGRAVRKRRWRLRVVAGRDQQRRNVAAHRRTGFLAVVRDAEDVAELQTRRRRLSGWTSSVARD